ncbi:unnamed protein product [Fusarium graminearum]|nr:unnamed protein product [Fusarium graminearum]
MAEQNDDDNDEEALCHGMAMGWAVMDGVEDAMEAQKKQVLNCRMPVRAQASL